MYACSYIKNNDFFPNLYSTRSVPLRYNEVFFKGSLAETAAFVKHGVPTVNQTL